jgi:hypothetical protein
VPGELPGPLGRCPRDLLAAHAFGVRVAAAPAAVTVTGGLRLPSHDLLEPFEHARHLLIIADCTRSRQVKAGLSDDQRSLYPQIEREFAAVLG